MYVCMYTHTLCSNQCSNYFVHLPTLIPQEPILCAPNDPDDARLLSEVAGQKIDEVFIGSCMTNIGHFRGSRVVYVCTVTIPSVNGVYVLCLQLRASCFLSTMASCPLACGLRRPLAWTRHSSSARATTPPTARLTNSMTMDMAIPFQHSPSASKCS